MQGGELGCRRTAQYLGEDPEMQVLPDLKVLEPDLL